MMPAVLWPANTYTHKLVYVTKHVPSDHVLGDGHSSGVVGFHRELEGLGEFEALPMFPCTSNFKGIQELLPGLKGS